MPALIYDVYAIGNALVDTEIEVSDSFLQEMEIGKGMMTLVDQVRQQSLLSALRTHTQPRKLASGGSAANTIIATQYFGGHTFYTCKVANDDNGDFYIRDLVAAGVATNMVNGHRPEGISGTCLVMVTPDAERTMNTFLGISEFVSEDDLDEDALRQSRYAYIEGYLVTSPSARDAAMKLRDMAQHYGVKTALTFSDPAIVKFFPDALRDVLGTGVDLLFCNSDEGMAFTGTQSAELAVESLREVAHCVVMTCGAKGALVFDGQQLHRIPAYPVTAIDTNGAGDMFAGAFLYGITHDQTHAAAGHLASNAAAKVVSDFGPRLTAEEHLAVRKQILGY